MADKLLIAVSAEGATLAEWRGRRIAECRSFASDDEGIAAFRDALKPFHDVPVHFVVDAVEEDYRFETLPHASGRDRAEMVGRKLRQHYRNTPYTASVLVGRDSGKRKDDRFLFSALTNPDLINEWLQAVIAQDLPVAGIYLLPLVTAELVEKIGAKAPNLLFVAQHVNGLRLTFFRDRRFRLSRLSRADVARTENRVRYFTEEISNTRLYLHALRTLTLDEPLTVVLLDREDNLAEVAVGVNTENPGLECLHYGRRELADRLGISEAVLDAAPHAIYLHLLGLQPPRSNLASAAVTAGYKRHQARRAVYALSGAVAGVAMVWTAINFYGAMTLRNETEDVARRTATLAAQYQEITRHFPRAPASAENLQKAVEIAQKLTESNRSPARMMALVSRALETNPEVFIKTFGWKYGTGFIEIEGSGGGTLPAAAATTPAPGNKAASADARRESARIEGEIRPFRGDYRGAIATIDRFARRLGDDPLVDEVRVVKLPLNVNPTLPLSGNTLDDPAETARAVADFQLLVLMKPDA